MCCMRKRYAYNILFFFIVIALPTSFYDCVYLVVNVVQRHRLHFLQIVADPANIHRCHLCGRFLANHFLVVFVLLVHRSLQSVGQHIAMIVDQIQA